VNPPEGMRTGVGAWPMDTNELPIVGSPRHGSGNSSFGLKGREGEVMSDADAISREETPETSTSETSANKESSDEAARQDACASHAEGRNQRVYTRHEWTSVVQIAWLGDLLSEPETIEYRARDLSAGGVSILSRAMIPLERKGIVLLGEGREQTIIRGIAVRHCEYKPDLGRYLIGCAWAAIPEGVKPVLASHPHGQRMHVRLVDPHALHEPDSDRSSGADVRRSA